MTRNIAYDGLRGWLLIIIACNHLYGSFVPELTRAPLGFVTAAEGFVFLSGFVAYLVYGRLAGDTAKLKRKIWHRSLTIYGFHISAITLTFALVGLFPLYETVWINYFNAANWIQEPVQSFWASVLLVEHPGYHDILILYLVPMLFLPFAINAIKKGKVLWVSAVSICVWLYAQVATAQSFAAPYGYVFSNLTQNVSYFDPLAWQIYFYTGVIVSYLKFDKGHNLVFPFWTKVALFSGAGAIFIVKHWFAELAQPYLGGHGTASLLFQVNLLLVVYVFMHLMQNIPWLFKLKYPVYLGQHALPVFAFHTVVIYFLLPWSQPYTTDKWYWDLLTCAAFITLLFIPAKLDELWRNYKKNKKSALIGQGLV